MIGTLIVALNAFAFLMIMLYSMVQFYLAIQYRKSKKIKTEIEPLENLPLVTVQLPIFNEKYVVRRLLETVAQLDYPKSKLEIQVLDDSTDETTAIVAAQINLMQSEGIDAQHIRRPNRQGFKAGALQHGLMSSKGSFLAIFDADFMPNPDFLIKTLPHFQDDRIGMVQARWDHLNENYNMATRLQAFGLNGHFTVEQSGRQASTALINFNGTAGIWRKDCIKEAGGWQSDTLTEDLDLSYRAQLRGWKLKYAEEIKAPAEIPVFMPAIKSQQYRWNKGGAETARKYLGKVLCSRLTGLQKFLASVHLLNGSVYVFLLTASLLSVPTIFLRSTSPELSFFIDLGVIFILGFIAIAYFYWTMSKAVRPNEAKGYFILNFPMFLTFSMGLALHNSIAVLEGYFGKKSPFIRTPKFNVIQPGDQWNKNTYIRFRVAPLTILEGILSLYFVFGIISAIYLGDFSMILFHVMLAAGFGFIFLNSVFQAHAKA